MSTMSPSNQGYGVAFEGDRSGQDALLQPEVKLQGVGEGGRRRIVACPTNGCNGQSGPDEQMGTHDPCSGRGGCTCSRGCSGWSDSHHCCLCGARRTIAPGCVERRIDVTPATRSATAFASLDTVRHADASEPAGREEQAGKHRQSAIDPLHSIRAADGTAHVRRKTGVAVFAGRRLTCP